MELILLQDVKNVGKEGELVKVKKGYARNYLLPRNLAMVSTPEALKIVKQRKKKRLEQLEKEKAQFEETAKRIAAISCTIAVESGVDDKIFGSVTSEMVRNALRQENINIDKRLIEIDEPIKKLGVYQINIKLHPEVTGILRVWVVKK